MQLGIRQQSGFGPRRQHQQPHQQQQRLQQSVQQLQQHCAAQIYGSMPPLLLSPSARQTLRVQCQQSLLHAALPPPVCSAATCAQQQHNAAGGGMCRRHRHYTTSVAARAAGPAGSSRGPAWQPQPQQQQQQGCPTPPPIVDPNSMDPNGLAGLFMAYAMQLQEAMQQQQKTPAGPSPGANVVLKDVGFHPPGAEHPLLGNVSFHLKPNQLGLIIGRSGSGKTTLLQLLAGLTEQTTGDVFIHRPTPGSHSSGLFVPTHIEQRMQQVGLVFQFPERHFLGDDVMQEMTFTWPRAMSHWGQRQAMAVRMQQVIDAVGLSDIPFTIPPSALSGGQQRRLALALQLVRAPSLLLLDEPLAGLDWHARREVVALLRELKKEATLLVVSHDLADIAPLVDCAWRMKMGGTMESVHWPPDSLSDMED